MTDDLPIPDFDQLPAGDLKHRIRALELPQLHTLIAHERDHAQRTGILELLEARREQLAGGAEPSTGDPAAVAAPEGASGTSPVQPATAAEPGTPLRHGVAEQTPQRGLP
ncbi:hypothetical protein [Nocardia asteroides]|uniref:hypothetical protein n=1 Tax=Nocardia asteroides TaxID=1824 RepID=UPI001E2C6F26|nr:hypothetical protein [Nocardia asteroides]UGT61622.1 hypothetical protein LTT61_31700 [Nocardia asteroides]